MGFGRIYEDAVKRVFKTIGCLVAGAALTASSPEPTPRAVRGDYAAVDANPVDQVAFEHLLAGLPQVRLDDEGTARTYYVWEGDMLLNAEEIRAIVFSKKAGAEPARGAQELLLQIRDDGQPSHWTRQNRALTWAADCATFTSAEQCTVARQLFNAAARDWVRACSDCRLSFREVPSTGAVRPGAGGTPPTVVLRFQPDQDAYLAIAFFANDPAFKRYVSVTPSFFATSFDRTGILRHEIGHVLGYRHEHNRALTGCYFEDNRWTALTPYDPKSVMHYFCGGGGSRELKLSSSDIAGHRQLYSRN